jgi:hypothetical protein
MVSIQSKNPDLMKSTKFLTFIIASILLISINASGQKSSDDKSVYKMGAGKINVTPDEPVLMVYEPKLSEAVHDSLFASALYFSGDNKQVLLITADLIGFSSPFVDETKKLINSKTGIPVENILISAVHNHGGPSTRMHENEPSEATDRYVSDLKQKLVRLAVSATRNPVPFKMATGKGSCYLNINRRAVFADGFIWLGRDPQKPCDHEVIVSKFEDMNGKLIALFVNWAAHGTVSGFENHQITGDWPGAAARLIRNEAGKNVIVALTVGASADIAPIYGPGVTYSSGCIDAVGYGVAKETMKVMTGITAVNVKNIQTAYTTITFPGKQHGTHRKPPDSFEPGPDVELRISGLKIGDLVLEGISGELMTEFGMQVKKSSPYTNTAIITHCNGSSGYICTDQSYKEGGYEIMTTRMMPGIEKPLVAKFLEQVHSY